MPTKTGKSGAAGRKAECRWQAIGQRTPPTGRPFAQTREASFLRSAAPASAAWEGQRRLTRSAVTSTGRGHKVENLAEGLGRRLLESAPRAPMRFRSPCGAV